MFNKKGKIGQKAIMTGVLVLVVIIVLFQVYAEMVPIAGEAGDDFNASNRCGDVGCFYNDSVSSDAPCRAENFSALSTECRTNTTIPLAGLFSSQGIVFLVVMAALFLVVMFGLLKKKD